MFGFGHHAASFVLISSNTRDRPDSPGPCEKCIGKAEPSKSLSLSLPYLSVMLLFVLVDNFIQVLIIAMIRNLSFSGRVKKIAQQQIFFIDAGRKR